MGQQRILIIEDDPHIAKLIRYNLEKAGFECLQTADGQQAFEELGRQKIHLIVLDIMLPGMDGFELCKEIKKKSAWAAIPARSWLKANWAAAPRSGLLCLWLLRRLNVLSNE